MTVAELLRDAAERLERAGVEDARLEAELLLAHALGAGRARVLASLGDAVPPGAGERLGPLLQRRLRREPLAYITGHREFFGIDLRCAPGALIPRPETELLVELALRELCARGEALRIVDVGTGGGAIAVAVALHAPCARVLAVDGSPEALAVARRNVEWHGLAARVELRRGDLLTGAGAFDLVLANLPYVAADDIASLAPEVRDHEPRAALDGGADGTEVVARLLAQAPAHLAPGGLLALEIGAGQAPLLLPAARAAFPAAAVCAIKDAAGHDRVLAVRATG